jgi:hypothetical protein
MLKFSIKYSPLDNGIVACRNMSGEDKKINKEKYCA